MPKYVRTGSFKSGSLPFSGGFNASKNDAQVNSTLDQLRAGGATIDEIRSLMTASFGDNILEYVIIYEAPSEIRQ